MHQLDWEPEIEIIRFSAADVIATSGMGDDLDEDELPGYIIR